MISARRCRVSGRVQGVFFRATARSRARDYEVCGYARNLPGGDVEVHAEGTPAAVDALCDWLWEGPPGAAVTAVECQPITPAGYADFTVE
ncbi:MAG: acylphosphatase [Thiohalobacteraceae bacterium]|nr:acylphosphatase [Gammaproteobacteria bacterium]